MGRCVPANGEQSQYVAEFFAVLDAVRNTNPNSTLTIFSTQEYVREAMNNKLSIWEHEGWVGTPHRDVLRCLAAELKARKTPTIFKLAEPGTPERMRCRQASVLAKEAARMHEDARWDLSLPGDTALPGMSLQGNRQRVFYRGIREIKTGKMTPRPSTTKTLEKVRKAAEDTFGRWASDTEIWRAVYVKEILPRTAQFLWKGLHNAHRIGKYWTHIPECADRATCKTCDETEDLEHILVGCQSPERRIIWEAAESLWLKKETNWPAVSLGTILGCGLADFRDEKGKPKRGTQRLYRILMSESAYLIWKLRNDRVISRDGEPANEEEIKNKWKYAINLRLQVDITLANRPVTGKRPAMAPQLVLATWSDTLDDEQSLPADWLREPRVLVGSRAFPRIPTRRHNSRGIG
jgi:ribonuclease HI